MLNELKKFKDNFLKKIEGKEIKIISHYDTDGITSAAITAKMLRKLGKKFSVSIVKQFERRMIQDLPKDKVVFLLDLGSSNLEHFSSLKTDVFVLDHHEVNSEVPKNVQIVNPRLIDGEEISSAGISYLLAKEIDEENKNLANLAVIGMIGDLLGKNISKYNNDVLKDADIVIKKGLLLYPATRPLNKTLEFSSNFFIPGITGNSRGAFYFLKKIGIPKVNGVYKSLIELNEDETSKLITAILLKRKDKKNDDLIGNIYLVKFFNRLEDARELSAMINACSRLDNPQIALSMCLGNAKARKKAEEIYANYKQHIVSALNYVANAKKIEGKGYVIINSKDKIKDTIIGTIASILSNSPIYEPGTIIVTLAYSPEGRIKVSARIAGRVGGVNVREILDSVIKSIGGECGGHPQAAGCLIEKKEEQNFIDLLRKKLEVRVVKV